MLHITYSSQDLHQTTKRHVTELESVFSHFNQYSTQSQEEYTEEIYKPKIVAVASNLSDLSMPEAREAGELLVNNDFSKFDPRYTQAFEGSWNKKIDIEAKLNQRVYDLEAKLNLQESPYARFILFNALRYMNKQDIDAFQLRKEYSEKTNSADLIPLLNKPLDVIETPFQPEMNGFCSLIAKDKRVYAVFTQEQFEFYLLFREFENNIERIGSLNMTGQSNDFYTELIKMFNIKGKYSDKAVESLERKLGNSIVESAFIGKALENAVRTKTSLSFEGKNRDCMLYENKWHGERFKVNKAGNYFGNNAEFDCDSMELGDVGSYALYGGKHKIKQLKVNKAGNLFGYNAEFESELMELGDVGSEALAGYDRKVKHKIKQFKVNKAEDWFGHKVILYNDKMEIKNGVFSGEVKGWEEK